MILTSESAATSFSTSFPVFSDFSFSAHSQDLKFIFSPLYSALTSQSLTSKSDNKIFCFAGSCNYGKTRESE